MPTANDPTTTPVTALHGFGLTFHQTRPLQNDGITTVEQLSTLIDEHDTHSQGSRLAAVPSLGPARIQMVRTAVQAWKKAT